MTKVGPIIDPFRRVCAAALHGHRERAKKDHQQLDYGLADLERMAHKTLTCPYCHTPLTAGTLAFDHVVPTSRRADYSLANLCCCCKSCNLAKGGGMSGEEFISLLELLRSFHPRAYGDVLGRLRQGGKMYRRRP